MLTEDDVRRIVREENERMMLTVPQMVTNMFNQKLAVQDSVGKFYKANPEFKDHEELVGRTISSLEQKNPGKNIEWLLDQATPLIKERIKQTSPLNLLPGAKPQDRRLKMPDIGEL